MTQDQREVIKKLADHSHVEDADVTIHPGLKGSREFPSEPLEVEVSDALVELPRLESADADKLPSKFEILVPYSYEEDNESVDLLLRFGIQVKGKKPVDDHHVELNYEERLLDWTYL